MSIAPIAPDRSIQVLAGAVPAQPCLLDGLFSIDVIYSGEWPIGNRLVAEARIQCIRHDLDELRLYGRVGQLLAESLGYGTIEFERNGRSHSKCQRI